MRRSTLAILLMTVGACTDDGGATTEGMVMVMSGAAGTTTEGATGGEVTAGATEAVPTTGEATGEPAEYCHGFDVRASTPFLELHVLGGELLEDGTLVPLECGGDGAWMFGLYPALGGWDPGRDTVVFTVEVDVEGFDVGPGGHFFRGEVEYYIGCEMFNGGVLGVVPVVPPGMLADLTMLDGKPAQLRVSVPAGAQVLTVERAVVLSAPMDLVVGGCPPG